MSKARILALTLLATTMASAQTPAPQRPHITGISHAGFFVSDLPSALNFWHTFLGYDVAYTLTKPNSTDVRIAFLKINDHQHIELFNEPPTTPHDRLSHICFTVDNAEHMRLYLNAHGFNIPPIHTTRAGDFAFEIKDPDGHLVEFVQSLPTGLEAKAAGKFLPSTRVADRIYHLGFLVGNSQKSIAFYGGLLGFVETWRGGANPKELSWINMRVPDGDDYVEFMLYPTLPPPSAWGGKNHLALPVPDIAKAVAALQQRNAYTKPMDIHVGVNGKRQVNLFDPDGTRVELMEPFTANGKPTPPSTAPPPPPSN